MYEGWTRPRLPTAGDSSPPPALLVPASAGLPTCLPVRSAPTQVRNRNRVEPVWTIQIMAYQWPLTAVRSREHLIPRQGAGRGKELPFDTTTDRTSRWSGNVTRTRGHDPVSVSRRGSRPDRVQFRGPWSRFAFCLVLGLRSVSFNCCVCNAPPARSSRLVISAANLVVQYISPC
ncbi:hypothetical protein B0T25DRAFT_121964 [Lasiosphaeria hispida]|uniref:Uncharacterized protein n=1 Tax=Lasiosphaeria hispida TaxID=260671 RepID=A0AAJ0HRZ3_9PEZI|nr:hypothetical protein B0T25DRAFT_121964 [Lasiosphaeria hispida]